MFARCLISEAGLDNSQENLKAWPWPDTFESGNERNGISSPFAQHNEVIIFQLFVPVVNFFHSG
jgi:hypothetical protein